MNIIVNAIVSFIGALVLHELGHFFAARLCGVPIKQAGLGWGPKLCGVRVSDVDCQLRVLPLGAYIQMDMAALQTRPLLQQLFILGAGIGVNLLLCVLTWGSLFSSLNLALAIGNMVPFYQLDGWKSGMVICRRIFGRSPFVEWVLTLGGGVIALSVFIRAFQISKMKMLFPSNIDSRRLARAYIALAFAQDVAKGYVSENNELHPLLTALDMSAKLLEEILEDVLPEEDLTATENTDYKELVM
jgi:membrane-associated protease RseP (regulator of RpoE activity)